MPTAEKVIDALGTGRRKTSVARVRIRAGNGKLTINERELDDFFKVQQDRKAVIAPLEHAGVRAMSTCEFSVHGGGSTGQAGACMQGIARALMKYDSDSGREAPREELPHPRCPHERTQEARSPRRSPWYAVLEALTCRSCGSRHQNRRNCPELMCGGRKSSAFSGGKSPSSPNFFVQT